LKVATFDLPYVNCAELFTLAYGKNQTVYKLNSNEAVENHYNNTILGNSLEELGYGNMNTAENMGSVFVF
jgi:hypothetical protein